MSKIPIHTEIDTSTLLAGVEKLNRLEMETMTPDEHQEYMALIAEEEQLRNQRVQVLLQLSQLRGISLPQIMEELGLISPGRA